MEANALYSIAARKQRRALAVLTVSDHIITHESMPSEQREKSLNAMVEIALSATLKG
jgi:purine-nucleoside phosphorylase